MQNLRNFDIEEIHRKETEKVKVTNTIDEQINN